MPEKQLGDDTQTDGNMTTGARSESDDGVVPGSSGEDGGLEAAYRQLLAGPDAVPTPRQFIELEALAARLEVTVQPAQHKGTCIDRQTGRAVDPEIAAELLWRADRQAWQLDAAEVHQAEVVAGISAHTGWRSLSMVQRRALASWRQRYPGLTYGTLLEEAPEQARRRLELHGWLADGALPESLPEPDLEMDEPEELESTDVQESQDEQVETEVTPQAVIEPPADVPEAHPTAKGPAPNAMYAEAGTIDEEILTAAAAEGIVPPEGAHGFIRIDPYGMANRLNDVVISYFDKAELDVPRGGMRQLAEKVAGFNGLGLEPETELPVGQYVWFPSRQQLLDWVRETDPKK